MNKFIHNLFLKNLLEFIKLKKDNFLKKKF